MLMIKHFLMQTATNLISSFRISASSPVVPFNQKLHWQGSRMADFGGYILLHRVKLTIEGLTFVWFSNNLMIRLLMNRLVGNFLFDQSCSQLADESSLSGSNNTVGRIPLSTLLVWMG